MNELKIKNEFVWQNDKLRFKIYIIHYFMKKYKLKINERIRN